MFVGIDIGTQSLKAIVTDAALVPLGEATCCYQPEFPRPGWAEQSTMLWEDALGPAVAGALAQAGVTAAAIRGIGVCGQLDGCIPVAADGTAVGNCIIWMDRRAQSELAGVCQDMVHETCGLNTDASHFAAKARWLKRNGGARAASRFHGPVSYIVERLTGRSVTDHAVASTSMLYDLDARAYDPALLAAFELDRSELPEIDEASASAGKLTAQGAALVGLPAGIPVAVGTGDDFSTPLGAGLVDEGQIGVVLGTGEVVAGICRRPLRDAGRLVETHGYPGGGYMLENPGWLSGGAVAWAMGILKIDGAAAFSELAGHAPAGSDGVLFIPALTGAMSPKWIANARGCFYGMTPAHGAEHLARAVMEGCAFAMRDVVDRLISLGLPARELTLLAGGSRSALWAQMRADIAGLPVTTPRYVHTSAIAAAMLAGVASGDYGNVRQAAARAAPAVNRYEPAAAARDVLSEAYARYRHLCACLDPIFHEPDPMRPL